MKSNVVIFSTRFIKESGTIFKQVSVEKENDSYLNPSLCNYFIANNQKELISLIADDPIKAASTAKRDANSIFNDMWQLIEKSGKNSQNEVHDAWDNSDEDPDTYILEVKKLLKSIDDNSANELRALITEYFSTRETETGKDFKLEDFERFKNKPAVNINVDNKTLKDRVTLYHVDLNDDEKYSEYGIYAVWPLDEKMPDKDENDISKEIVCKSEWVNTLIKSVIPKAREKVNIYILLHRRDLESTQDSQFQTIFCNKTNDSFIKEGAKEGDFPAKICVSLCVFQHPDIEFKELTKDLDEVTAKSLYDTVKDIVETSRICQHLINISAILSAWEIYSSSFMGEIDNLKNLVGDKKWFDAEWGGLRRGAKVLEKWNDNTNRKWLLFVNNQINKHIKAYT